MPLRFCSSIVKPFAWPRPRIAAGTVAKTCASRKFLNAAVARATIASAPFALALAVAPVGEVDEALAGVLPARPAAATAAGDGEHRADVLRFLRLEIFLDR